MMARVDGALRALLMLLVAWWLVGCALYSYPHPERPGQAEKRSAEAREKKTGGEGEEKPGAQEKEGEEAHREPLPPPPVSY